MVRPPVRQPVDQPRVAVVGEKDRLVRGEEGVELDVRQAVRQLASGGRYTRMTFPFLFTTWSMKPGSWWEKPLWSCRQTCEVRR